MAGTALSGQWELGGCGKITELVKGRPGVSRLQFSMLTLTPRGHSYPRASVLIVGVLGLEEAFHTVFLSFRFQVPHLFQVCGF